MSALINKPRYARVHALLHRLWTQARDAPRYDKQVWNAFQAAIDYLVRPPEPWAEDALDERIARLVRPKHDAGRTAPRAAWQPNPDLPGAWLLDLGPLGDLSVYPVPGEPSDRCWRAVWGNWHGDAGWDAGGLPAAAAAQQAATAWLRGALAAAQAALDGTVPSPQRRWRVYFEREGWWAAWVDDEGEEGWLTPPDPRGSHRVNFRATREEAEADGRASGLEKWTP